MRSAELLHENVEAAWASGEPAEARLENYQRARDAENTGLYYFSFCLSQIDPWRDPQVAAMFSGQARPPIPAAAMAQA